jgi:hypothetical protein
MEGLLHFQNINFEGKVNYKHQYHPTNRDVHLHFALGKHFIFFQNGCGVDLVRLGNLICPIK